jgi:hypothetical protein
MGLAAAQGSGLRRGSDGYNRLRGAVAAIPVAEVAWTKAQRVVEMARHPTYTPKSGQGVGIARVNHDPSATTFTTYLGYIGHIQRYYRKKADSWAERRNNLKAIASTLENNAPKT